MKPDNFTLPVKADRMNSTRQEPILEIGKRELKPINYSGIVNQFYNAFKQRDESYINNNLKHGQAGKSFDHRKVFLPEVQFQNELLRQTYEHAKDNSFSFKLVSKKIKDELSKKLLDDKNIKSMPDREKIYDRLIQITEGRIRGIESIIDVVKKRKKIAERSDDYFIGTSDILDVSKKIDLVEYANSASGSEVRLIQVKSKLEDTQDSDQIINEHQKYLDTFIPAIQEIIRKDHADKLKNLVQKKDQVSEKELEVMRAKWNTMGMAFTETNGDKLSLQDFCDYIKEKLVGYSEEITKDDILLFKEIVTTKELLQGVEMLFDEEFLPKEDRKELIEYMSTIEEDFGTILKQYLEKDGVINLAEVDFYSIITTPDGVVKEKLLVNPLKEVVKKKVTI